MKKYGCSFTGDNSDIGDTTEVEFKFISDVNGERDAVSIDVANRDPAQKKRKAMWCCGCCAEDNEVSLFHYISNFSNIYFEIFVIALLHFPVHLLCLSFLYTLWTGPDPEAKNR